MFAEIVFFVVKLSYLFVFLVNCLFNYQLEPMSFQPDQKYDAIEDAHSVERKYGDNHRTFT